MMTEIKNILTRYYAFYIAIAVFIADRIIKAVVSQNLLYNDNLTIWGGILSLTKTFNTGAAFGILQNNAFYLAIFSIMVMMAISAFLIKRCKTINIINIVCWGLILGGTAGNLFDRLNSGYVIDFIKLEFVNFPIFNIADLCINAGSFILIVYLLFFADKKNNHINQTHS